MSVEASRMEEFPVLIGTEIAYFHRVDGYYDKQRDADVVKFVHEVQGVGSPTHIDPDQASHAIEAHLSDNYYNLDVRSVHVEREEYPDENYVFEVVVDSYLYGEQTFSEALSADIDKRDVRFDI